MTTATISPRELFAAQAAGQPVELIDVRTPVEFREVHVPFARNRPLDQLSPGEFATGAAGTGQPVYVICRSGSRGRMACDKLAAATSRPVINVDGGTEAWSAAGLPVVRGPQAIALERQVRIAAGSLVVLGATLGAFVHPAWIGLAAFVGAGLVFAGLTDTCAMGMLLARMPWNQVPSPAAAAGGTCTTPSQTPCCKV